MLPARHFLSGLLLTGSLAAAAIGAAAQPMLYEQRLPEGFAFVRVVNALPGAATVRPDFAEADVPLGESGADRVSPYYVAEDVAQRPVRFRVTMAGRTLDVQAPVRGGALNTILLQREGEGIAAVSLADEAEYNQTRARVTFYNAVPGCGGGALALAPSGQPVFSDLPPNSARMRGLNPARAVVRASCNGQRAADLDLGALRAGGLYSILFMAPAGSPILFLVQDRIAPR